MTLMNKIAHQAREMRANMQTALARTDETSRRRTDSGGRQRGTAIKRATDKLRAALNR